MKFLVTAHTGCNGTPHNTIESLLKGAEWGADVNEVDVRATRDEIPLLWHDDALPIKGNGRVLIENLTYDEILTLTKKDEIDFSHPKSKITPLEEIFAVVKEKNLQLNMDLKDDECIVPVARLVKKWDLAESIIFSGCEKVRASYLKSNYPEFQVLLNVDEPFLERADYTYKMKARLICDTAISAGCCGINIRHNLYKPELQEYADQRFLPIVVWTVEPQDGFQTYIEQGVHSITTLHVKELVTLRRKMREDL